MQNLQRFFGFSAALTDNLEPLRIEILRKRAERVVFLYNFDTDQIHVYFNVLTIVRCDATHFGVAELARRLESLDLRFDVNPKQVKSQKIRFHNDLVDQQADTDVRLGTRDPSKRTPPLARWQALRSRRRLETAARCWKSWRKLGSGL